MDKKVWNVICAVGLILATAAASAAGADSAPAGETGVTEAGYASAALAVVSYDNLVRTGGYEPSSATGFSVTDYEDGISEIRVSDGRRYLVVPGEAAGTAAGQDTGAADQSAAEAAGTAASQDTGAADQSAAEAAGPAAGQDTGAADQSAAEDGAPQGAVTVEDLPDDMVLIRQPAGKIYLANSAGMCRFDSIGAVSSVAYSGTRQEDWEIQSAADAMESGDMIYAGKYSEPDYELLLTGGCDLAIENLMVLHKPEVMEKLTSLGIPVFLDRASEEDEPLGRTEWVIPYGILTGRREEAEQAFSKQRDMVKALKGLPPTGKTVAYFYVNSQGQIVCPRSDEAVPKMLKTAGGDYVPDSLTDDGEGLRSSTRMDMETFLTGAGQADVLVYDATINPISSVSDLIGQNALFAQFKAVKEGQVYLTGTGMYQNSDKTGSLIRDFHAMLTGEGGMEYVKKLE